MILQNQLPLIFKSTRIENEWNDPRLFTVLRAQILYANWLAFKHTGHWTRINNIWRSRAEQEAICRETGKPFYWSTHNYWRGGDQTPLTWIPDGVGIAIASRVSLAFPYEGTPGIQSCIWHDVGLGAHWHHQCWITEPNYTIPGEASLASI